MPQVVSNSLELEIVTEKLTPALTLRLFSNNVTPVGATTAASFTETSGGGYAALPILFAGWGIVAGDPCIATFSPIQQWSFTGPTALPIYGYYVTRDSDGMLMWSERFATALVPFNAVAGSIIRVQLRFSAQSLN